MAGRRWLKYSARVLFALLLLIVVTVIAAYLLMRASLPALDGNAVLAGAASPITLTRDKLGTVTIKAGSAPDAMRALGYVHAQERFFEMDLTRRSAAGELSELFGKVAIDTDKKKRIHRFRSRAAAIFAVAEADQRALFTAYAEGVNGGLTALASRPWQYWVLRAQPEAWREEDSVLVMCEMFYMLQAKSFGDAYEKMRLREVVDPAILSWLQPQGGDWDAALDGSAIGIAPLPVATTLDVRKYPPAKLIKPGARDGETMIGSNAWAIGGARTAHGGGMLANDMHLGHSVPNIWFRTQLEFDGQRIAGVTLPGVPALVAGSNGQIAWGFTNSYGKWFDWIAVSKAEIDNPANRKQEKILVKGGDAVMLDIVETRAGPVMREQKGQSYALHWLAHERDAINANLGKLMFAKDVDEAIAIAHESGMPHQNIHIVDKAGNVAWTIAGRMPVRDTANSEVKWLPSADYPLVKNPADARTWTANSRQLGGAGGAAIGEGGPDIGARAQQIRDRLREKDKMSETDLHAIQLDNESRFLKRWAELAKKITLPADAANSPAKHLQSWNGRADTDQVGHRIARSFRLKVLDQLWSSWIEAAAPGLPDKKSWDGRFEYAAWSALTEKPMHLLPQPHKSWDEFLQTQLTETVNELAANAGSLDKATWGARNTAKIRHPFSRVIPVVGYLLDMPAIPLAGDNHMPRVATPGFGQSERMVVSPGREQDGILSMPGGQSGHPLSPFFGSGHGDWVAGEKTPLLAGPAKHTLTFAPR
jgi:penicillin G amidase